MKERIKLCTILFSKNLLDIGDIIGIKGTVFTTKVGEISVKVKEPYRSYKIFKAITFTKGGCRWSCS